MSALRGAPVPADLTIDREHGRASVNGAELYLSEREFALLIALAAEPARLLTYEQLMAEVFADGRGGSRRVLDANASRLRASSNCAGRRA